MKYEIFIASYNTVYIKGIYNKDGTNTEHNNIQQNISTHI